MRWAVAVGYLAACACACASARAAPGGAACEPLGSAARQEPLSQLLRELAGVRKLAVENWSRDDPIVRHGGGSDVELMATLSGQVNLIVRYARARECPAKWRVEAIWVLPTQHGAVGGAAPLPAAAAPPVPITPDRAAMELYMQGHGG